MKYLHILLFLFLPLFVWGQFPNNPRKLVLGYQTTADGIIYRASGAPAFTPSTANDARAYIDTDNGDLYVYEGSWIQIASLAMVSDSLDVIRSLIGSPTNSEGDTTVIYCPSHGLTLSSFVGEVAALQDDCTLADASSSGTLQTRYVINSTHPDSLTVQISGLVNKPAHGLTPGVQYFLRDTPNDGDHSTTAGTVESKTFVVFNDDYLHLVDPSASGVSLEIPVVNIPAAAFSVYGTDAKSPTDTAVQNIAEIYAAANVIVSGSYLIAYNTTISDNELYRLNADGSSSPFHIWQWNGSVVTRFSSNPVAIHTQDTLYGSSGLLPLDTIVPTGDYPTTAEVVTWLENNYDNNGLRLPNGSIVYYVGTGTEAEPDASWIIIDDLSGTGVTNFDRIVKSIGGGAAAAVVGVDGSVQYASGGFHASDPTNFFYDEGLVALGIGTNTPSETLDVFGDSQTSGQFLAGNGTVSAPGYSFTSDPNSGIWSDGSDEVRISNNGVQNVTIESNGDFGVRTTNPLVDLHVFGEAASNVSFAIERATAGRYLDFQVASGTTNMIWSNGEDFIFREANVGRSIGGAPSASTLRMRIEGSTGYVAIGTPTIDQELDVSGDVEATGQFLAGNGSASSPAYTFSNDLNSGMWYTGSADNVAFGTGGSELFRMEENGRIGFGTTLPTVPFHFEQNDVLPMLIQTTKTVATTGASAVLRLKMETTAGESSGTWGPGISFYHEDQTSGDQQMAFMYATRNGADNTSNMVFTVQNAGSQNTVVTFQNDGTIRWDDYGSEENNGEARGYLGADLNGVQVRVERYRTVMTLTGGSTTTAAATAEKLDNDSAGTTSTQGQTRGFTVSAGRATYTGTTTMEFLVTLSVTGETATDSESQFIIRENGTTTINSATVDMLATDKENVAFQGVVSLATNDYVEPYILTTDAEDYTNQKVTMEIVPYQ